MLRVAFSIPFLTTYLILPFLMQKVTCVTWANDMY